MAKKEEEIRKAIELLKKEGFRVNLPPKRQMSMLSYFLFTGKEINSHGIRRLIKKENTFVTFIDTEGNMLKRHAQFIYAKLRDFQINGPKDEKMPRYRIAKAMTPEGKAIVSLDGKLYDINTPCTRKELGTERIRKFK